MQKKLKNLIFVFGISSSGKSYYIKKKYLKTLEKQDYNLKFFHEIKKKFDLNNNENYIIHVCSDFFISKKNNVQKNFKRDKTIQKILNLNHKKKIYICYCPDSLILIRRSIRKKAEHFFAKFFLKKVFLMKDLSNFYNNFLSYTKMFFSRVDQKKHNMLLRYISQRELTIETFDFFKKNHISNDIKIIFSKKNSFNEITIDEFKYGLPSASLEKKIK